MPKFKKVQRSQRPGGQNAADAQAKRQANQDRRSPEAVQPASQQAVDVLGRTSGRNNGFIRGGRRG